MNNQEILDSAPEGATHSDCYEYMRHVHDGEWEYWSKATGWEETTPQGDTRSLEDIKRIVELEKERDVLPAFIIRRMPPLKALSSTYKLCKMVSNEVDTVLEAHNLEQQANGIDSLVDKLMFYEFNNQNFISVDDLLSEFQELRNQAKALKETK
tara:strand:+ start:205 stop:666 length:462 start_codon:yes stop_codon:yes gene_type:complete